MGTDTQGWAQLPRGGHNYPGSAQLIDSGGPVGITTHGWAQLSMGGHNYTVHRVGHSLSRGGTTTHRWSQLSRPGPNYPGVDITSTHGWAAQLLSSGGHNYPWESTTDQGWAQLPWGGHSFYPWVATTTT